MSAPTAELFDRVSDILRSIGEEKQAAAKSASDPGGLEGKSSHPTATADNLTRSAPEGAQSADNAKVIKATIPGGGVDSVSDVTPASAPKAQDAQLGDAVPTGSDVPSTKKKPEDKDEGGLGGTSHPANAEHQKFSAANLADASDDDLYKLAAELGNALAADLANAVQPTSVEKAAAAGAVVAAATPTRMVDEDAVAAGVISQIVKMAEHQADLIAAELAATAKELQKKANEDADEDDKNGDSDPSEGDSGDATAGDKSDPGAKSGDPAAASGLLAAMSGGGAGGAPGADPSAGGDPGAGGPGAGAPGGGGEEEALQQLAMALMELGIDPAMLAQMVSGQGGAPGAGGMPGGPDAGGMPPDAGGMPPEAAGAAKMASAVQTFKASGKFHFTEAKQGSEERHIRDYMKDHILELLRRSQS